MTHGQGRTQQHAADHQRTCFSQLTHFAYVCQNTKERFRFVFLATEKNKWTHFDKQLSCAPDSQARQTTALPQLVHCFSTHTHTHACTDTCARAHIQTHTYSHIHTTHADTCTRPCMRQVTSSLTVRGVYWLIWAGSMKERSYCVKR
jgi:hypothetical protein